MAENINLSPTIKQYTEAENQITGIYNKVAGISGTAQDISGQKAMIKQLLEKIKNKKFLNQKDLANAVADAEHYQRNILGHDFEP
jgi:predicted  nucleic acid-binding Zn-ribbon protein